jgi:hypothetical protein
MAVQWTRAGRSALVGCATAIGVVALGLTALVVLMGAALSTMDWSLFEFGDDDANPELERAIDACDADAVEAELEKNSDQFDGGAFELSSRDGPTMESAIACGPEITGLLTRYSVGNDGGDAVLQAAVASRQPELAAAALDAGAVIDGQDDAGDTALLDAVTSDDGPMVELLLSRGADVNIANEGGHTPLLRAVGFDRPLLVARLLAAGADPNVTATVTYLEMMAASGGYLDEDGLPVPPEETPILETLEELRPALGYETSGSLSIAPVTPLYVAVVVSSDEIVHALLDAGADPTIGAGPAAHLPADAAELLGRTELAARIRAAGG